MFGNTRCFSYTDPVTNEEIYFEHVGDQSIDELKSMLNIPADVVLTETAIGVERINREKRLSLLNMTDSMVVADSTAQTALRAYRQTLRDITTHANWPNLNDEDWPAMPNQFDN